MARIFYECLDTNQPSGGARRLYRHVEILVKHGFDAHVLHHNKGFRIDWFTSMAPVAYWQEEGTLGSDDIIVIPEGHIEVIRRTHGWACSRVVIVLNWGNAFANLKVGESWSNYDVRHIIAGSLYEQDVVLRSMGLESTVIVSGIDSQMFRPAQKKCGIAFMTRKIPEALHLILAMFRVAFPRYADVPLIPLDGISHRSIATSLSEAAIFLTHSLPEGLSRKTLEAMCSGCLVVGFAGGGSREFMKHGQNCYLAPDADFMLAAEYLGIAVGDFLHDGANAMRKNARETALLYSMEREELAVIEYWRAFLAAAASS